MGNMEEQLDRRLGINAGMKRAILQDLQCLLHEHHALVRLFKSALERMPNDDYKVVIKADKRPSGTHERTFNAPTVDELAILIVGEQLEKRDIVLTRRDTGQLQQISETHRSYDALEYPLMFWQGEDGYYFNIKMINPLNGEETTKKVSSMNYYAYRLMIRQNADNYLLRFRRLFQQYCVDMYVKIETERLTFIRLIQAKLRSEEYIHLRDAIVFYFSSTGLRNGVVIFVVRFFFWRTILVVGSFLSPNKCRAKVAQKRFFRYLIQLLVLMLMLVTQWFQVIVNSWFGVDFGP
ncbi:uncharacterized protein LOC121529855 [Drosophila eugracilis]|uniref:uncharacterized protein LOC121529855 n=1 Tax=Drosophila eugracilis TaxID=29029 RepID=UPI001BDA8C96|nr:uncharacterized protein LOC121529855 [Drosophila eugracilis]